MAKYVIDCGKFPSAANCDLKITGSDKEAVVDIQARMKELMEKWKKAFGVPEKERIQLGKDIWKIAAEDVYIIGVIGMGPASMGVRVVKNNMGNIPSRQYNSPDGKTPGISRPATFFYKN